MPGPRLTYGRAVTVTTGSPKSSATVPGGLQVRRWNAPPRFDVALAAVFVVLTIAEAFFN